MIPAVFRSNDSQPRHPNPTQVNHAPSNLKILEVLKTYPIAGGRQVEIVYSSEKGISARINGEDDKTISRNYICGIPKGILDRPITLSIYLREAILKLARLDVSNFKLYVNYGLNGGMFATPRSPVEEINIPDILERMSELEASVTSKVQDKDVVMIVGNTGSGKSLLANYLSGRQVRLETMPDSLTKVAVCDDPIMEVGHGFSSKTWTPQLHYDDQSQLHLYDCPGFFDNRSPAFDILNGVAIRSIGASARSVKLIVLVNYHALLADRAKGLADTIEIMNKLLGHDLSQHSHSILLMISHVPSEAQDLTLQRLRNYVNANPTFAALSDRIVFYDPVDQLDPETTGCVRRDDLIQKIRSSVPISNPGEIFNLALGAETNQVLLRLIDGLGMQMEEKFDARNFADFKVKFELFKRLRAMGCEEIKTRCDQIQHLLSLKILQLTGNRDCFLIFQRQIKEIMSPDFDSETDAAIANIQNQIRHRDELYSLKKIQAKKQADRELLKLKAEQILAPVELVGSLGITAFFSFFERVSKREAQEWLFTYAFEAKDMHLNRLEEAWVDYDKAHHEFSSVVRPQSTMNENDFTPAEYESVEYRIDHQQGKVLYKYEFGESPCYFGPGPSDKISKLQEKLESAVSSLHFKKEDCLRYVKDVVYPT